MNILTSISQEIRYTYLEKLKTIKKKLIKKLIKNLYPLPPAPYPLPSTTHVVLCRKKPFPLQGFLPYLAPYHPINSQRIFSTSRDCKAAAFELDNKQLLRQHALEIKNLIYYLLWQNTSFSLNLVLKFIKY